MTKYDPEKHHRQSIRLKGYDYSQAGLYFITLNCQDRAHLFGTIQDGILLLNAFGQIAHDEWLRTDTVRDNVRLHEFIIMPNHIHGIIEITHFKGEKNTSGEFKSPSQTIGSIIRGYKIAVIKKIKDFINEQESLNNQTKLQTDHDNYSSCGCELRFTSPLTTTDKIIKEIIGLDYKIWQRNYYENIIRTEKSYYTISNYIINNPKKWKEDCFW